jgi:hypothetical protein
LLDENTHSSRCGFRDVLSIHHETRGQIWLREIRKTGVPTRKKAIDFAIVAWNFAIIRERSGEKALDEMMRKTAKPGTDEAEIQEGRRHFDMLFKRKRELFPDNQRMILDYEFTETRDNFHLNVVSILPGDQRSAFF